MPTLKTIGVSFVATVLLLTPLLATSKGQARDVASKPAALAPATKAPPVPLLWKVSDADNSIYLLGSFHLLKRDDYPLSKDIDNAFAAADKLVFEVPPAEMQDPATAQKALARAGYGDARTLSKVLPPTMRDKFNALLLQRGGSIAQFDPFEPWFVNLTLVMGLSQSMGFRGEDGLDQHLMRRAAKSGKPTSGLESVDSQLQALDSTPMKEQIASLREFVDDPEKMPGMLDELHRAWRQGDVVTLERLTRSEMLANTPETYRLLNVVRNDAWVPKLRKLLDGSSSEDALVVVGAMHLLGRDGVVDRLRAKGYRVERVCSACKPGKSGKPAKPAKPTAAPGRQPIIGTLSPTRWNSMPDLPNCPRCGMENTYPDGNNLVCADCGHEWPVTGGVDAADADVVVKDSNGQVLENGDTVVVIKDLKVKGSSIPLKQGAVIKNIRLVDGDAEHIEGHSDKIKGLVLKTCFLKRA